MTAQDVSTDEAAAGVESRRRFIVRSLVATGAVWTAPAMTQVHTALGAVGSEPGPTDSETETVSATETETVGPTDTETETVSPTDTETETVSPTDTETTPGGTGGNPSEQPSTPTGGSTPPTTVGGVTQERPVVTVASGDSSGPRVLRTATAVGSHETLAATGAAVGAVGATGLAAIAAGSVALRRTAAGGRAVAADGPGVDDASEQDDASGQDDASAQEHD